MSPRKSNPATSVSTLLTSLPTDDLSFMLANGQARYRSYEENVLLYLPGDPCIAIDLVVEGEIAVDKLDETGRLTRIIQFGAGEVFGANLVFSDLKIYPFTVTTLKKTKLLQFEPNALIQLAMKDRHVLESMLKAISTKSFVLSRGMDYLSGRSIEDKIRIYLKQNLPPDVKRLELNLSKKALAEYLGVSRTSLSRTLRLMKEAGVIDFDRSSITFLE
jgi:CRP-like cAMP-binding protein